MPCFRCGAVQTDPERGPSPWARGLSGDVQVLVCPDCQRDPQWSAHLRRCPACGSTRLSRVLGTTRCSACGSVRDDERPMTPATDAAAPSPLRAEVDAAILRLLGDHSGRSQGGPAATLGPAGSHSSAG